MRRNWNSIHRLWLVTAIAAFIILALEVLGPTGFTFGKRTSTNPVVVLLTLMVLLQSVQLRRLEPKE